jgi:hypothetical protein
VGHGHRMRPESQGTTRIPTTRQCAAGTAPVSVGSGYTSGSTDPGNAVAGTAAAVGSGDRYVIHV